MKITPVILCGGSGTRLWPLSRQHYPKQFLKLVGNTTLFQQSISRAVALENNDIQIEEILIVTNENHRFLVLEQLNELNLKIPTNILLEPEAKNTAPALTLAALRAKDTNPASVLIVNPSDHYVEDLNQFIKAIHQAIKVTADRTIVTLGIYPTRAETGFGYIHYEGEGLVKDVLSFKEKPDVKTLQNMMDKGQYAWNSGIFILKSMTWLNSIEESNCKLYNSIEKAWKRKKIDNWFVRPNEEIFKLSDSDSIDYAVMEKTNELDIIVKLVILDAGWSDLGSFNALDETEEKDNEGNIFRGDVVSLNTKNTIAIASKKNVSLLGVESLIVVETADCILVANKNDAGSIKNLVTALEKKHQPLLNENTKVNRPWGWFETIDQGTNYKVKKIYVNPGARLSYQSHKFRNEHWVVLKGLATIIYDEKKMILKHDESTYIKKHIKHQLINQEKKPLLIIEVQTGMKVIEADIQRFEDIYGRN